VKHFLLTILLFTFTTLMAAVDVGAGEEKKMQYLVPRLASAKGEHKKFTVDANWNKPVWQNVEPLELTYFMGDRPEHFPRTQAKLLYDDEALYVIFRVEDRYIRAVAEQHQGNVYLDSCVEFFFAPADDVEKAYFNLEMNCGGTILLHYQTIPRIEPIKLTKEDLALIQVSSTQPKIVDPEITSPTVWSVEYRLPLSILKKYYPSFVQPESGVTWRANFYKCADRTSHPHWLTWAKVGHPSPNFHIPKFFGRIVFQ